MVLAAHEGGALVGVWPFASIRFGGLRMWVPLVRLPAVRADAAVLEHLPVDAVLAREPAPFVDLSALADRRAYLAARSRNRRGSLKRHRRSPSCPSARLPVPCSAMWRRSRFCRGGAVQQAGQRFVPEQSGVQQRVAQLDHRVAPQRRVSGREVGEPAARSSRAHGMGEAGGWVSEVSSASPVRLSRKATSAATSSSPHASCTCSRSSAWEKVGVSSRSA